ncbi:TonB domain-containing protein [Chitinispirillum alkaliphilum]|nr:TonB domain-containing protein [Chitinispirillum alkaliphilum]
MQGSGGLKTGGSSGAGRRGVTGIGSGGTGYGSGMGGGGGGIADLMGNLTSGGSSNLDMRTRGELKVTAPVAQGGALTGGRSRASIQRIVQQNMASLRHEYNRRLRDQPGLSGRITVKFAINEFGVVIHCEVTESTINDSVLEQQVVQRIRRWNFGQIDQPGDITEIVYPFVFSQ